MAFMRRARECKRSWTDLFDGDSRLPSFLLIQDRETDGTRRVDVGVEKRWCEFACDPRQRSDIVNDGRDAKGHVTSICKLTFGWSTGIICMGKRTEIGERPMVSLNWTD